APTIGAEAHLPFGGVKQTGNGHREGGWEVYEFYSETKVCYVDYSGKLQRAQIDNYEAGPYCAAASPGLPASRERGRPGGPACAFAPFGATFDSGGRSRLPTAVTL